MQMFMQRASRILVNGRQSGTRIFGQSAIGASRLRQSAETIKNTAMRRNTKLGAELSARICSLMRIGGSVGGGDIVFLKRPSSSEL